MTLIEVTTPKLQKIFNRINYEINKHLQFYISPLDNDINKIFKQQEADAENVKFKRWIVQDENKKNLGRIAAFITKHYKINGTNFPIGGIGFFDCIDNQKTANFLFDTAKEWLMSHGVEGMDGPIDFHNRDQYWGLLLKGFDEPPLYGMNFNPPYYKKLFEDYGFKEFYRQYYYLTHKDSIPQLIFERSEKLEAKGIFHTENVDLKNLNKYIDDFVIVYNQAWAQHNDGKLMDAKKVTQLFKDIKLFFKEFLAVFAYHKNSPIAMYISIIDPNAYFEKFKGKLNIINLMKLFYQVYISPPKNYKIYSMIFGVIPQFQRLGIECMLIKHVQMYLEKNGLGNRLEIGWVGEWNPRCLNLYRKISNKENRVLCTYRYIFDESKNHFEKHPIMDYCVN